jgi:hypothetical protein
MSERRQVRVDQASFDELDDQLGEDRGPNGEPSATDFIVTELLTIVEEFAERFDSLPPALVPGRQPTSGGGEGPGRPRRRAGTPTAR